MSIPGSSQSNEGPGSDHATPASDAALVPAATDGALPLLDLTAIQTLEDQLDNPLIARTFVRDFTRLWERRHAALAAAIGSYNTVAALEAVLSLKTSSTMVGGVRLALMAGQIENVIRSRDVREAQALLAGIEECGDATVAELQASYVLRGP